MADLQWHAQNVRRRLQRTARIAIDRPTRDRWRRERFWKQAARHTTLVGTRDRFGNHVVLNTADPWVSRETFVDGAFDAGHFDNLVSALAGRGFAPELILDIGANIGTSTLELMATFPQAKGLAVEPHPENYRLLRQNIVANGLEDRVRTVNAAVGDVDGTVALTVSADNPGDHQVGGGAGPTIEVPMVRLDSLVTIEGPTLLWLDVQGYEGHVLRAAGDVLGWPAFVEFWPHRLKETGGYESFLAAVSRYSTVLRASEDLRAVSDLDALGRTLETTQAFTDLLLLP